MTPDAKAESAPRRHLRNLAAFTSGASLQFVSPPHNLAWLHWFAFVPLLVVLVPENRRRNFRLGYLCGFSGVFFLFFWLAVTIDTFSNIPLVLAAGIVALFAAVWGLPYGLLTMAVHPLRRRFGVGWVAVFPAVWVAVEFLQPALFPYYQGVGQYRVLAVFQLASVFGAYGVTYLLLLVNSAIAEVLMSRGSRASLAMLGLVAAVFGGNLAFGSWRIQQVETTLAVAPTIRVSLIQQHVTMVTRLQERGNAVLKSWVDLTRQVEDEAPDLVIWPEGSVYYNPDEGKVKELFAQMATEGKYNFLLGGGTQKKDKDTGKRRAWNSAYLFDRTGEITGRYDKMVPLPFGEYLPWPVSYLKNYIEGVGNFQAGETATVFQADNVRFTTPICYEAILESQMRTLMDTDLFINITNDAWFGDTAAPHQHAMLSAVHAVEFGRPMLRIAYTGISMVVEPHGAILHETKPYTDVATVVPIRLGKFETPYRTWGRGFPYACALAAALALLAVRRRVTPAPDAA